MAATDALASARRIARAPMGMLDQLGAQMSFYLRALAWTPRTIRRYKKEVLRLLSEVVFGSGSLAVIGGTVGVIAAMSFFTGTEVGLQGFAALDQLGIASYSGFISAFFNTREIAPLVAGLALSATVGCGFTAQLGAMRISEEIDALEVMAVPSLPFLVTTRIVAGFIAVIPLYVIGLLSSYFATYVILVYYFDQSAGTYSHYFHLFLPPGDVVDGLADGVAGLVPVAGRRRFSGRIAAATDSHVLLALEDGEATGAPSEIEIPIADIARAKLKLTDELIAAHTGRN